MFCPLCFLGYHLSHRKQTNIVNNTHSRGKTQHVRCSTSDFRITRWVALCNLDFTEIKWSSWTRLSPDGLSVLISKANTTGSLPLSSPSAFVLSFPFLLSSQTLIDLYAVSSPRVFLTRHLVLPVLTSCFSRYICKYHETIKTVLSRAEWEPQIGSRHSNGLVKSTPRVYRGTRSPTGS